MAKANHADGRGDSTAGGSDGPYLVLGPEEPPIGGVSRYCRALCDLLDRSGEGCVQLDLTRTSSEQLGIGRSPLQRLMKRAVGGPSYAFRTSIARHRPSLVVDNHELLWSGSGASNEFQRLATCPYVLVIHDGRFPQRVLADRDGGRAIRRRLEWIAGAVCMSDAIRTALTELAPGVRSVRLSPWLTGGAAPATGPWPEPLAGFFRRHTRTIATSGALVEHYGLRDLLEAFAELRSRGAETGLVILLGSFASEEPTASLLREAIDRWGDDAIVALTDFPEGARVIADCDVYVRPSRVDSFGLGLHEALQAGVPAIAARHETRPDGVVQYQAGDVPELVAALDHALSTPARRAAEERASEIRSTADRNRLDTLAALRSFVRPVA